MLIVELQIVIGLIVYGMFKMDTIEQKVYNTNKFLFELNLEKNLKEITLIGDNELTIGHIDAPVSIIMYSKFSCSYCKEFFTNSFPKLDSQFIKTNKVKLTIRYLISSSSQQSGLVQLAYKSQANGSFREFLELTHELGRDPEDLRLQVAEKLGIDISSPDLYDWSLLNEARAAGIRKTPTFILDGVQYVGLPEGDLFKNKIEDLL